jgi:hypothetical protein
LKENYTFQCRQWLQPRPFQHSRPSAREGFDVVQCFFEVIFNPLQAYEPDIVFLKEEALMEMKFFF